MKTAIYTSRSGLRHDTGEGHPECADRLRVLLDMFETDQGLNAIPLIAAEAVDRDLILNVHKLAYVNKLEDSIPDDGYISFGMDTIMSPNSLEAAYDAAGACVQAVDDILSGKVERAFCAVRPPGHHAELDQAMGFCFFNNVFIAAKYAQKKGFQRIMILDFDVHHGNGSDAMVRHEEGMYFISSQEMPLFPGTGNPKDDIDQAVLNITFSAGDGSQRFRDVYERDVFPEILRYSPDLLLISAGFDAHCDDPLANINLEDKDYSWLGQRIAELSKRLGCPSVSTLEGGYNLEALKRSVRAYLTAYFEI